MFLGPTGVGKTELCKALAEFLFDNEAAMVGGEKEGVAQRSLLTRNRGCVLSPKRTRPLSQLNRLQSSPRLSLRPSADAGPAGHV